MFTTVIAVDREHLPELQAVWPTWRQWHPEIASSQIVLLADLSGGLPVSFLSCFHGLNFKFIPVRRQEDSQRDKMLSALLLDAPKLVTTLHWLKIDCDTLATGPGPPLTDFVTDDIQSIAASGWGYTKPVDSIRSLDEWYECATGEPPLWEHRALEPGESRKAVAKSGNYVLYTPHDHTRARERAWRGRIIGWLSIINTAFSRRVAEFLVEYPPPFISHDTLLWYLAERWQTPARVIKWKHFGWDHRLGLRSVQQAVAEVMKDVAPTTEVQVSSPDPVLPFAPKPQVALDIPEIPQIKADIQYKGDVAVMSMPLTPLASTRETPPHSHKLGEIISNHFGGTAKPLVGVEIGCYCGDTSRHLLKTFPNLTLFMVDPWMEWPDKEKFQGDQVSGATQAEFDEWRRIAYAQTHEFRRRRVVLEMPSAEASRARIPLDFGFIDGGHDYESVRTDISWTWPLIKPGGILLGHDIFHRRFTGVTKAVQEYAAENGLEMIGFRRKIWGYVKK